MNVVCSGMPNRSPAPRSPLIAVAVSAVLAIALPAIAETNAASPAMGARVSAVVGQGARFDPNTGPDDLIDGQTRSRMVVSGAPYTVTLELFQTMPVDRIAFVASEYETEMSPKDIEIALDDGTTVQHTLERGLPVNRKSTWQEVKLGKTTRTIRITVKTCYQPSEKVNWGGIGEIAVYTPEDLASRFQISGYDAKAPTFINQPSIRADEKPVPVTMPPQVTGDAYPRTVLTHVEAAELKKKIEASEEGRKALAILINHANGALQGEIVIPDPKGELSQMKRGNDPTFGAHDKLSKAVGNLGRAYLFTGDKRYAERAAEILRGYAKVYDQYPEHKGVNAQDTGKISSQRLSECMWAIPLLIGYDAIHDSGALSADDHKLIETGLVRPVIEFIWKKKPSEIAAANDKRNPKWRSETPPAPAKRRPIGNWLNFYNSTTMLAGAVLNDRDYIDVAAANFRELIRNGIGEDGMWGEGAVGYQYFALAGMMPGLETAARHGIDLWSFDDNRLKLLFDTPRLYAYPDGSMPGINDSTRVSGAGWQTIVCDYAYQRYNDARYAGVINATGRQLHFSEGLYMPTVIFEKLPEPERVQYPSTVFTGLGYAITRAGNGIYTLMDYGPHGGVHGHLDKLNLILFANGDELGGEPRFRWYEDPLHGQWVKTSLAHNTMTIDQRNQAACEGRLLCYDASTPVRVMRAEAAGAYPGAVLDRTVITTDDAVYDIFSARSAFDRTFDRTLRYTGKLQQMKDGASTPLGERDGYQHVKVASRENADAGWTGTWKAEKGPLQVAVAARAGQEIILGTEPDQVHLAVLRRTGKTADVGVVYRPGDKPALAARMLDTGSADVVGMESGDVTIFVSHKPGTWKSAGVESDAMVVFLRTENGKVTQAMFAGGTFVRTPGGEMRVDQPSNVFGNGLSVSQSWRP